jgi:3-methyladenine DNA glycosylase AlkD
MLREMGKRDKNLLIDFLNKNVKKMKRITLRYCLEKFSKKERDYWYAK